MAGNWGPGGGGFFRILGIVYLVKEIRRRRRERQQGESTGAPDSRSPED